MMDTPAERLASVRLAQVQAYLAQAEVAAVAASVLANPAALLSFEEPGDLTASVDEAGVATIDVRGPLTQRATCLSRGYDEVARVFGATVADPRVQAVVLALDSPGGDVAGLFDAIDAMREAAVVAGKPVVAVASERAYSAAYALAAVADEIVVPRTGGVGSVGVITTMSSAHRALQQSGVDVAVVRSGSEKADGHPALPLSPEAVGRVQARVDELAAMFVRHVAARRGMTQTAVRALEAGVRHGQAAVEAGLADRVGTLADVQRALGARSSAGAAGAEKNMNENEKKLIATALAVTGESTPEAAEAALQGFRARAARAAELEAEVKSLGEQLATVQSERRRAQRESALEERRRNGRLAPAVEKSEGWRAMVEGFGDEAFGAYLRSLDAMPARVAAPEVPAALPAEGSTLTAEEIASGKRFGLSEADLLEAKKTEPRRGFRAGASQEATED